MKCILKAVKMSIDHYHRNQRAVQSLRSTYQQNCSKNEKPVYAVSPPEQEKPKTKMQMVKYKGWLSMEPRGPIPGI